MVQDQIPQTTDTSRIDDTRSWRLIKSVFLVIVVLFHAWLFWDAYISNASLCNSSFGWITEGCSHPLQSAIKLMAIISPFTLLISYICYLIIMGITKYVIYGRMDVVNIFSEARRNLIIFAITIAAVLWLPGILKDISQNKPLDPTPSVSADQFPFDDSAAQDSWYNRHDIPMSDRCYTTMPCSDLEWKRALGNKLTPDEQYEVKRDWCQKYAADWNQSVEQCIADDL